MASKKSPRSQKANWPAGADDPPKGERRRPKSANDAESTGAAKPVESWHVILESLPRQPKQPISFRVDQDVLQFFKQDGPRYQTRMNAVLRAFMTASKEGDIE